MASAVPQEPAPNTATGELLAAAALMAQPARSVGLLGRAVLVLCVQRVEVDGRQQELRESALGHEVRYRRACVGEEYPGAHAAHGTLDVLLREVAHHEDARLLHLDQEDGGLVLLC